MPRAAAKRGRAAVKRRTKTSRPKRKAPMRGAAKGRRKTRRSSAAT